MKFYESITRVNAQVGMKQEPDAEVKIEETNETISKQPVKSKVSTKRSSSDRTAVAADYSLKLKKNKKNFSDF